MCRDKRNTGDFFEKHMVRVPKEVDKYNPTFPLFAKPYDGSLSTNLHYIKKADELTQEILDDEKLLFMEYIDNKVYKEYTVDMYYGRDNKVKCIVPRERIEVRAGEINKGRTAKNEIVDFVEKPKEFVSDLAVIGIYYFKDVAVLKNELQLVLDNNIIHGGEYQINDGIKQMMAKGMKFVPGKVDEWMDCGNKDVTVETNTRMLGFLHNDGEHLVDYDVKLENSTIIPPCYIGEDVVLINATVGPNVSLGKGCHVIDSTIKNSLIQTHAHIKNAKLDNAMIGNHASFDGNFTSISIGDYSVLE